MGSPTLAELTEEMRRLSRGLDEAQEELGRCVREEADAERQYRLAKATAYLAAEGRTVPEKEALADKAVDQERYRAHLAGGLSKSALEAVRNRRTQLSVLQTVSNALREEMRFVQTAPQEIA